MMQRVVMHLFETVQCQCGFHHVLGLNEDELVQQHLFQNAHRVPLTDHLLHIMIAGHTDEQREIELQWLKEETGTVSTCLVKKQTMPSGTTALISTSNRP